MECTAHTKIQAHVLGQRSPLLRVRWPGLLLGGLLHSTLSLLSGPLYDLDRLPTNHLSQSLFKATFLFQLY